MKKIFTISIFSLLFLVAFFPNATSAQIITTIDLPYYGTPKVYDSNDTIAVCYTNANRLYYRFKHDTTWVQTALGYFDNVSAISVYNYNIYVY
jgi:hypothetical protein